MRPKRMMVILLLAGGSLFGLFLTLINAGVSSAQEPQGVALRQESANRSAGFFYGYHRSHRGGGLRGGK